MNKLRIFLVDDHKVLREGLATLINTQIDMEVIGQASSGRELLKQIIECAPAVVVMDISMTEVNGIHATIQVRQTCPEVQVVVLTRHNEPGYVRQMLQAGARGYVLKQAAADELIVAIRTVAAGQSYLDSTLVNRVVHTFAHPQTSGSDAPETDLSEREATVVRLIAYGYSNKEIATQIGISVKTVDTYKMRAMEKLGLHSRVGLVRYALQCGWLDPS